MRRSPWHCFEFYQCLLAEGSPSPGAECGVLLQRLEAERLSKEKQLSVQTLQERHPGCAAALAGRGCLQQDMTLPSLIQAPCNGLPYPPSAAGEGKAAARCLQAWCAEDSSSGLPDCINALNPMRSRRHCRWTLKCSVPQRACGLDPVRADYDFDELLCSCLAGPRGSGVQSTADDTIPRMDMLARPGTKLSEGWIQVRIFRLPK